MLVCGRCKVLSIAISNQNVCTLIKQIKRVIVACKCSRDFIVLLCTTRLTPLIFDCIKIVNLIMWRNLLFMFLTLVFDCIEIVTLIMQWNPIVYVHSFNLWLHKNYYFNHAKKSIVCVCNFNLWLHKNCYFNHMQKIYCSRS